MPRCLKLWLLLLAALCGMARGQALSPGNASYTIEARLDPGTAESRWRDLWGELPLVMPTEVLHGLYDGGSGAGLEDYWRLLRSSPRAAGAFLWSWSDEAVVRSDRGGALDSDGNHAPDGVLAGVEAALAATTGQATMPTGDAQRTRQRQQVPRRTSARVGRSF